MHHIPVLCQETVEKMVHDKNGVYIDGTFGAGGHSRAILEQLSPEGRLIAIDRDPAAIALASSIQDSRFSIHQMLFSEINSSFPALKGKISGILLDLGMSNIQLNAQRGFSFLRKDPLDMRMNQEGLSAMDWINGTKLADMISVFKTYEVSFTNRIATAICAYRRSKKITDTETLAQIIAEQYPYRPAKHPATHVFRAIRMCINQEIEEIALFFRENIDLLHPEGRLLIITFHSMEAQMVKMYAKQMLKPFAKIKSSYHEIKKNPQARSAVLRIFKTL